MISHPLTNLNWFSIDQVHPKTNNCKKKIKCQTSSIKNWLEPLCYNIFISQFIMNRSGSLLLAITGKKKKNKYKDLIDWESLYYNIFITIDSQSISFPCTTNLWKKTKYKGLIDWESIGNPSVTTFSFHDWFSIDQFSLYNKYWEKSKIQRLDRLRIDGKQNFIST